MFVESNSNWAFSSTGDFMDDGGSLKSFIQKNTSILSVKDPELYMDARISPLSLVYYGFCLKNENYKVNLHFAEIMFTDDKTYSSLGRRVFDIYIQVDFCSVLPFFICLSFQFFVKNGYCWHILFYV